jgi:hypothetical protein
VSELKKYTFSNCLGRIEWVSNDLIDARDWSRGRLHLIVTLNLSELKMRSEKYCRNVT